MESPAASSDKEPSVQTSDTVTYDGKQYKIAREGTAEILELQQTTDPKTSKNGQSKAQSVFYNPVQQYNRDLSVLAIKAFGEDLAAIRKARHQRRLDNLAKKLQEKKRKTPREWGENEETDTRVKRIKTQDQRAGPNGSSDSAMVIADEPSAHDEIQPILTSKESQQVSVNNGHASTENGNTDDAVQRAPDGPKAGKDGVTPDPQPAFRILDALSATGLRALRYAKEIPMVTSVTANDLSSSATASIKVNIEHNKVTPKVVPHTCDAVEHMHYAASQAQRLQGLYQVIDLDPYGTAAPFLDSALRALVDGGLLCVTCTDAGVFASVGYLEKTYSQYGGLPIKGPHAHEGGLRLILHAIATAAARYGLAIEPLLSLSIDFYARIFVRVHRSPVEVKFLASKTMLVYSCDTGCGAWSTQHLARPNKKEARNGDIIYSFTSATAPNTGTHCEHCGFKTHQAGPMWGGPLHNPYFVQSILDMLPHLDKKNYGTIPRIEGMLSVALNETLEDTTSHHPKKESSTDRPVPPSDPAARSNHPFFFLPSALSRILHCISPSDAAIRGALLHLGYRVTRSHTKGGSIGTDAPWDVIWEVMREWIRQKSPVKEGAVKERTAGWGIMQKDRSKIDLIEAKDIIRKVADSNNVQSISELRKDLEAALYRVSKTEDGAKAKGDVGRPESVKSMIPGGTENGNEIEDIQGIGKSETQKHASSSTPQDTPLCKLKIVFDEELGREPQGKRVVRYQVNPRPDWGPMNRAKGGI